MDSPRAATIRAVEEAELFEIDQGTFDRLLADMIHVPDFEPTLQQLAELAAALLRAPGDRTAGRARRRGEWMVVGAGRSVVQQGEEGDSFYAVASGRFDIVTDGELERTDRAGRRTSARSRCSWTCRERRA